MADEPVDLLISRMIDGDLTPAEEQGLRERLARDPDAARLHRQLETTVQLTRSLRPVEAPPTLLGRVREAIRHEPPFAAAPGLEERAAAGDAELDAMLSAPPARAVLETGQPDGTGVAVTEVVTLQGDSVLGITHFDHTTTYAVEPGGVLPALSRLVRRREEPPQRQFSLGEDPSSDVWVGPELLGGRTKVTLVDTDDHGSRINLLPGMAGGVTLADGSRVGLQEMAQGGQAFALPAGAKVRLGLGEYTFLVHSVLPGRYPKLVTEFDRKPLSFTAIALLGHLIFFGTIIFVPPDPLGLSVEDLLAGDDRFVPYELLAMEMLEQDLETEDFQEEADDEPQGGQGRRHAGEEGQMGRQDAPKNDSRYGIKGPADNPDPHMARERAKEYAATSGILSVLQSDAPTSPFGQDTALGVDPESALGLLMGNQIGDSFGYGGLGLRGTGRGGGGDGRGTIGLGRLGTIGHGGGGGTGQGYGRGAGGLKGRRASVPSISTGTAAVRGSLSKEVIRRYIRRSINQIRYCYEQQLARRPDLAGRISIRFVISPSGAVTTSSVAENTLGDGAVGDCVSRAVQRIAFPQPEGGGVVIVTYPFMFQSAEGG
jgi:hypothetical protein